MDMRGHASFVDYFVICSAESTRQITAIVNAVEQQVHPQLRLHHREGTADSGWVLLDFSDMMVHVFSPDQREHYDLEAAWGQAHQVVRVP